MKKNCSVGFLAYMITKDGKRYCYGVRKTYLEIFIECAFDHNCSVEFLGFCKMPRNTGIMVVE